MRPGAAVCSTHLRLDFSPYLSPLNWVFVFRIQTAQPWKVALESKESLERSSGEWLKHYKVKSYIFLVLKNIRKEIKVKISYLTGKETTIDTFLNILKFLCMY